MIGSKGLMLPLVASLAMFLVFAPNFAYSQSMSSIEETATTTTSSSTPTSTTPEITTVTEPISTITTSATPEITTIGEPTTSTITTTSSATSTASPASLIAEGAVNSPCNATFDCQPDKHLECIEGACHCPTPQVFDIRSDRCTIPLGKQCDSSDILGESLCPEHSECFMDRCVCKTGYSMHTLTRCKSDLIEPRSSERKPIVLWPRQPKEGESSSDEKGSCNSETCDESKGLTCQEETCTCKDSKEIFVEEFGRCLNTTMQKTLKDALSLVSTSEDEIKSFVKLLEKFDDADQEVGGSDHYNSPVHQLLGLLGGDDYRGGSSHRSQVAPSYSYGGELQSAAQEPVTESTLPAGGSTGESGNSPAAGGETGGSRGGPAEIRIPPPESPISPVSAANAESSAESGEALAYSQETTESIKKPSPAYPSLPLDHLQYSPQSQEPQIVQRQAPPYLQGEGIPLQGLATIPGGNQFRLPFQGGGFGGQGYGGYGGLGGFGGQGLGGFGGYGGQQGGQGGFNPSFGGFGGGPQGGGFGGGGGGPGGGHGGGPGPEPPKSEGLLIDVAEFVGKSLKLIDRFLPLVHAINDVLKKEKLFDKKEGLFGLGLGGGGGGGGPEGPRGRRFGDISKEIEELKDGGDGTLKKLLS